MAGKPEHLPTSRNLQEPNEEYENSWHDWYVYLPPQFDLVPDLFVEMKLPPRILPAYTRIMYYMRMHKSEASRLKWERVIWYTGSMQIFLD